MVNLRSQKRIASAVLGCGKRKVWLDPAEQKEIAQANSRANIRKLAKVGNKYFELNFPHETFRTAMSSASQL